MPSSIKPEVKAYLSVKITRPEPTRLFNVETAYASNELSIDLKREQRPELRGLSSVEECFRILAICFPEYCTKLNTADLKTVSLTIEKMLGTDGLAYVTIRRI